jgi:hypothetical protein
MDDLQNIAAGRLGCGAILCATPTIPDLDPAVVLMAAVMLGEVRGGDLGGYEAAASVIMDNAGGAAAVGNSVAVQMEALKPNIYGTWSQNNIAWAAAYYGMTGDMPTHLGRSGTDYSAGVYSGPV